MTFIKNHIEKIEKRKGITRLSKKELTIYFFICILFTIMHNIFFKPKSSSFLSFSGNIMFGNITAALMLELGRHYILKKIKTPIFDNKKIKLINISRKELFFIILIGVFTNALEGQVTSIWLLGCHIIYGIISLKSNNIIEASLLHSISRISFFYF